MLEKTEEPDVKINSQEFMLKEDRHSNVSEVQKFVIKDILETIGDAPKEGTLLDIGCGAGEFIYHIQKDLPNFKYTGADIMDELLVKGRKYCPDAEFKNASIADEPFKVLQEQYDFVTVIGVFTFFSDLDRVIRDTLDLVKPGGSMVAFNFFNPNPVDMITRYRLPESEHPDKWEGGWNIISKNTYENILNTIGDVEYYWKDFNIGMDIPKRPDQWMRTWTMKTEQNPYQLFNGAGQLINFSLLHVKKNV